MSSAHRYLLKTEGLRSAVSKPPYVLLFALPLSLLTFCARSSLRVVPRTPVTACRPRPQAQAPPLGVRAPGDVTRVAEEWRARYRKGAELLGSHPAPGQSCRRCGHRLAAVAVMRSTRESPLLGAPAVESDEAEQVRRPFWRG